VEWNDKQKDDKKDLIINSAGLKVVHPKSIHLNNAAPTGQRYGVKLLYVF